MDRTILNNDAQTLSRDQYHDMDYQIMAILFEIHNRMGRLHDEKTYQDELAYLARKAGFQVKTEEPLTISYKSFSKTYYQDVVINNGIIYELKVQQALGPRNKNQLLNYLLLSGRHYGKLINFGSTSLEYEYVTTTLTKEICISLHYQENEWDASNPAIATFMNILKPLLQAWGSRLDVNLYTEAITFLLGGEDQVLQPVNITSDARLIGTKKIHLITHNHAFKITASKHPTKMETDLRKFLTHAELNAIHWVNLNGPTIQFKTLEKRK